MKKLFLLLLALPLFFGSCSKDDDNGTIDLKTPELTLKFGEELQIKATSGTKITYTSENKYYATVSESGMVAAGRFGETYIVLNDGNETKKVKVIIPKSSDLYPDPNIEWGISRASLIQKLGSPESETDNGIGYGDYSASAPIAMYLFDDNNKLIASTVMVKTGYSSELGTHLGERYMPLAVLDYTIFFINAESISDATMAVGSEVYNLTYWSVMYFPYSDKEKTGTTSVRSKVKMEAINDLMSKLTE